MASATTQVLTFALLVVPVLLMARDWMPKWIHRAPFAIISVAILLRLHAFWTADITDAQVVGYLPSNSTGFSAIVHIFDGPDGQMLGLLFGFSSGLALTKPEVIVHRWATLCWILILGWGIDSDAFVEMAATPLSDHPSALDWRSAIYPFLGVGLSMLVIPTIVHIENASLSPLGASIAVCILLIDLSSSPIGWMFVGLIAHRLSSLRIDNVRGTSPRRRWMGLMLTFFLSSGLLIIGLAWFAYGEQYTLAIWPSRQAVGWILLCGVVGALTPLIGYDARPRPEAWGFHTGTILAPALLPGLPLIEHAQLPILILAITMPIVATLPEYRPKLSINRRFVESIVLLSILPIWILLSDIIPMSLLALILLLPLLIHFEYPGDEEE